MSILRQTTIRGHLYETVMLDIEASERVLVVLLRALGAGMSALRIDGGAIPAMVDSMGGAPLKGQAIAAMAQAFAGGVGAVLSNMTAADLKTLRTEFAPVSSVDVGGTGALAKLPMVMGEMYRGNTAEMYEWLLWCVEVNFADFFAAARAKIGDAIALASKPTEADPV